MASSVRAGESIVDCSEASELMRMALDMTTANGPRTGPASTAKMDSWFSSLPAPRPSVPTPAQAMTPRAQSTYTAMITSTVTEAARPGVRSGSSVSSFMVRVTSQPQKRKMDRDTPAATTEKSPAVKGLNQSSCTGVGSKPAPFEAWTRAATAKAPSATSWKTTRTYCSFLVASMPRWEIHPARAR